MHPKDVFGFLCVVFFSTLTGDAFSKLTTKKVTLRIIIPETLSSEYCFCFCVFNFVFCGFAYNIWKDFYLKEGRKGGRKEGEGKVLGEILMFRAFIREIGEKVQNVLVYEQK